MELKELLSAEIARLGVVRAACKAAGQREAAREIQCAIRATKRAERLVTPASNGGARAAEPA